MWTWTEKAEVYNCKGPVNLGHDMKQKGKIKDMNSLKLSISPLTPFAFPPLTIMSLQIVDFQGIWRLDLSERFLHWSNSENLHKTYKYSQPLTKGTRFPKLQKRSGKVKDLSFIHTDLHTPTCHCGLWDSFQAWQKYKHVLELCLHYSTDTAQGTYYEFWCAFFN